MSKSRATGTKWETRLVRWLADTTGLPVERRTLSGRHDKGDVAGMPGLVIEAKNCRALDLACWVDEARIEAVNAGARWGVVAFPRRGKGDAGAGYALMDLATFADLYAAAIHPKGGES